MEKLTKQDIQFIDSYLKKRGIKYLDVRVELIDHLSTDFEEYSKVVLLEDYLKSKLQFINTFEKNRQSKLHWHYQKQLWLQFFKQFYTFKGLVLIAILVILLIAGLNQITIKSITSVALIFSAAINFSSFFIHFKKRKNIENMQSSLFVFAILSLPALPLYCYSQINTYIESNSLIFMVFWLIVILLNISAFQLVYQLKQDVIRNYKKLIMP